VWDGTPYVSDIPECLQAAYGTAGEGEEGKSVGLLWGSTMSIHDRFGNDEDILDEEFSETEDSDNEEEPSSSAAETLTLVRRNKSDSYQYRINEIAIDPFILSDFPSEDGLGAQVNSSGFSEELADLRQQLIKEVRRLIKNVLTLRQAQVMALRLQGKTQVEIGQKLGIHQTTVHKTISGNIDYNNGGACYGGAIKKLRKMCFKDERVLSLLKRIEEVRAEEGVE
jgi:DNA-directed RNA polymerase specialized sigma24 family protein